MRLIGDWKWRIDGENAGFTLAEMLVVLVVLGLVISGVLSLYLTQTRISSNEISLAGSSARIVSALNSALSTAESAAAILVGATIGGQSYTTSNTEVVLSLPSKNIDDEIVPGELDTVVFTKNASNQLVMITQASPGSSRTSGTKILVPEITSLVIQYENEVNKTLSSYFNFETSHNAPLFAGSQNISFTYRVTLKNR